MTSSDRKVFAVTVRIGRRMAGAPFGRLEITDHGITVRSWPSAWTGSRSASKDTITAVDFRGWAAIHIKFTDDQGILDDVAVNPPRFRPVLREFRARGYPVTVHIGLPFLSRRHRRPDSESTPPGS